MLGAHCIETGFSCHNTLEFLFVTRSRLSPIFRFRSSFRGSSFAVVRNLQQTTAPSGLDGLRLAFLLLFALDCGYSRLILSMDGVPFDSLSTAKKILKQK